MYVTHLINLEGGASAPLAPLDPTLALLLLISQNQYLHGVAMPRVSAQLFKENSAGRSAPEYIEASAHT